MNRKRIVSQTFLGMIWKVENVGTCKNAENSAGLRPAPRGVAHTNDLLSVPTLQRESAGHRPAPRGVAHGFDLCTAQEYISCPVSLIQRDAL
jgi:hypothetical protein